MGEKPSLWQLFCRSFQLSATTVGEGFVILSAMENIYVERFGWLSREEMLDITAMTQSAPGAVAVNAALLAGAKLRGVAGAIVSLIGCMLAKIAVSLCRKNLFSKLGHAASVAVMPLWR